MIPLSTKTDLIAKAKPIIADVCAKRLGQMTHVPRIEVDFIASFVENGSRKIETAWRRILSPHHIDVRVAGVFCHQSPMVEVQALPPNIVKSRCELADLLLIHSHAAANGKEYWRAVLMQAKVCKPEGYKQADQPQLFLYQSWPSFSIQASGFDRRLRDFNQDGRSGRYGLVSNRGWFVSSPMSRLDTRTPVNLDLATFLAEMLFDMDPAQPQRKSLSGRQVYHQSQYDWSPTIWEILRYTARKPLRHMGKYHGNYHHEISRLGGSFLAALETHGAGASVPPAADLAMPEGQGVSALVVRSEMEGFRAHGKS